MTVIKTGQRLWDSTTWDMAYKWAKEQFGEGNVIGRGSYWTFTHEKDALMFALIWS